jgi:hypothetical protein
MTRDELQLDGFGFYKAYYQGRLVRITDPNIPTILDEYSIQRTVPWQELTAIAQPKIIIHMFIATPDSVIEGSDIVVSWSVENASQIRITRGGDTIGYVAESGSLNVKVPSDSRYRYHTRDKYDLDLGLVAIGDGGKETASTRVTVFPKSKGVGTTGADIIFQTEEVARILNGGNFGVSTTSPESKPESNNKIKSTIERTPLYSQYSEPHVCPDHPTVEDATYHASQIENEIELFLSELRQQSKENTRK